MGGGETGSNYLEAKTKEKVYIVSGPEFGSLKDHVLVITKVLYGLPTSGLRWNERLSNYLQCMGFQPYKMEPNIWRRRVDNKWDLHYEFVEVYVDNLIIASKSPQLIVCALTNKHSFKLKGTRPISYHLGCDFPRYGKNELCLAPRKHIENMSDSYASIFGSKPKSIYHSPL